jgi:hypothetical protein
MEILGSFWIRVFDGQDGGGGRGGLPVQIIHTIAIGKRLPRRDGDAATEAP